MAGADTSETCAPPVVRRRWEQCHEVPKGNGGISVNGCVRWLIDPLHH
jgi:hypothetical protein